MTFLDRRNGAGTGNGIGGNRRTSGTAAGTSPDHAPTIGPWADSTDEALMRGIAERDADALEALFDRYSGRVHNLCRRVLDGDDASAEDAMIDAFWELWQRPGRFDRRRATVLTYLLMLARCRAIDRRRSAGAQRRLHKPLGEADPAEQEPSDGEEPAESADFDDFAVASAAFNRLEPRYRDAVRLCVVQGLTASQAATLLREPLGTIKSRIRKGIILMRELVRTSQGRIDESKGANLAD